MARFWEWAGTVENQRCAKPTAQKLRMTPLFPCSVLSHAFTCFHNFKKRDEKNIEKQNSRDQISSARFSQGSKLLQCLVQCPHRHLRLTMPWEVPPKVGRPPEADRIHSTPSRPHKAKIGQPHCRGKTWRRMLPDAAGCWDDDRYDRYDRWWHEAQPKEWLNKAISAHFNHFLARSDVFCLLLLSGVHDVMAPVWRMPTGMPWGEASAQQWRWCSKS